MQNFDVQNNFLLVNKALQIGCNDDVFWLCYNETKRCPLFSKFAAFSRLKNCQRVEKHFVKHCQRFYNGLNNITHALRTIINAL